MLISSSKCPMRSIIMEKGMILFFLSLFVTYLVDSSYPKNIYLFKMGVVKLFFQIGG